jgi:elongation factor G
VAEPPGPLIEIAVEPKSRADWERIKQALAQLAAEDDAFRVKVDAESGLMIVQGIDKPQLEAVVAQLPQRFGVAVNVGQPQVAYCETITRPAEIDYTHKAQTGGSGQFARFKFRLLPLPSGSGLVFENRARAAALPHEFVAAIEKGLRWAAEQGAIAGFPVIDFGVELLDGAYHHTDSSAMAFERAAREAFKQGALKAKPVLLEPIMSIEVLSPDEHMGDIIGDLNQRRVQITAMETRDNDWLISAMIPLAHTFGYADGLARLSRSRATFSMTFDHYEPVPPSTPPDDLFPPAVGMRA